MASKAAIGQSDAPPENSYYTDVRNESKNDDKSYGSCWDNIPVGIILFGALCIVCSSVALNQTQYRICSKLLGPEFQNLQPSCRYWGNMAFIIVVFSIVTLLLLSMPIYQLWERLFRKSKSKQKNAARCWMTLFYISLLFTLVSIVVQITTSGTSLIPLLANFAKPYCHTIVTHFSQLDNLLSVLTPETIDFVYQQYDDTRQNVNRICYVVQTMEGKDIWIFQIVAIVAHILCYATAYKNCSKGRRFIDKSYSFDNQDKTISVSA